MALCRRHGTHSGGGIRRQFSSSNDNSNNNNNNKDDDDDHKVDYYNRFPGIEGKSKDVEYPELTDKYMIEEWKAFEKFKRPTTITHADVDFDRLTTNALFKKITKQTPKDMKEMLLLKGYESAYMGNPYIAANQICKYVVPTLAKRAMKNVDKYRRHKIWRQYEWMKERQRTKAK